MDYTFTWGEGPEDVRVETSGPVDVDVLGLAFDFRVFPTVPAAREWLSARP